MALIAKEVLVQKIAMPFFNPMTEQIPMHLHLKCRLIFVPISGFYCNKRIWRGKRALISPPTRIAIATSTMMNSVFNHKTKVALIILRIATRSSQSTFLPKNRNGKTRVFLRIWRVKKLTPILPWIFRAEVHMSKNSEGISCLRCQRSAGLISKSVIEFRAEQ